MSSAKKWFRATVVQNNGIALHKAFESKSQAEDYVAKNDKGKKTAKKRIHEFDGPKFKLEQ